MRPGFVVATLGCRTNQFDSARLAQALTAAGYEDRSGGGPVDLVVVNTCTVTARADQQSRQLIRRLGRAHPGARVVVAGCLAGLEAEALRVLPGVALVLGPAEEDRFQAWLRGERENLPAPPASRPFPDLGRLAGQLGPGGRAATPEPGQDAGWGTNVTQAKVKERGLAPGGRAATPERGQDAGWGMDVTRAKVRERGLAPGGRTRALLKVQDGCDNACTYCRVRLARGPSRSLALASALAAAGDLLAAGHPEIVLTGVHLGGYGRDLTPPASLAQLVEELLKIDRDFRLRLSSLDPHEITRELLQAAAGAAKFCPHFHLPLQSGDAGVLARMNRPSRPEEFAAAVGAIRAAWPEAAVGADVIVGFPGEDEAAFGATLALIETLPLAYLHVFPFSPRPGTAAAALDGRLDPAVVLARAEVLRRLGRSKRRAYADRAGGQVTTMAVENRRDARTGLLTGVSPTYLPLLVEGGDELMNRLVRVRVERPWQGKLLARLV